MTRNLVASISIISLCLAAVTPASAQMYRFSGSDGPRGANASLSVRVPLGARGRAEPPTVGLTLSYGRAIDAGTAIGEPAVRQVRLADLRFGGDGLRRAQVAGFDLADFDRDRRASAGGEPRRNRTWTFVLIAILGMGVGVGAEMLIDGSEEEEAADTPPPTSPGVG